MHTHRYVHTYAQNIKVHILVEFHISYRPFSCVIENVIVIENLSYQILKMNINWENLIIFKTVFNI